MSEPEKPGPRAFISYVREDSQKADELRRRLQEAGIPVWLDTVDLWPGENWKAKIRHAITNDALAFIACFSRHSLIRDRSYQRKELKLAIEELSLRSPDMPWLVPVRFDDCEIPGMNIGGDHTLDSLVWVDFFGEGADEAADKLIASVRRILDRAQPPSQPVAIAASRAPVAPRVSPPQPSQAPAVAASRGQVHPRVSWRLVTGLVVALMAAGSVVAWATGSGTPSPSGGASRPFIAATLTDSGCRPGAVAFSPDATTIAVGSLGCKGVNPGTYLFNAVTHANIRVLSIPGSGGVQALAFDTNRKWLAEGDKGGTTHIWNFATHNLIATLHDPASKDVTSLAFNPRGTRLAVGDANGVTYLFSVASWAIVATFGNPSPSGVFSVTFSPNGRILAVGGERGATSLWDVAARVRTATFHNPLHWAASSVAFSPHGIALAIGDDNMTQGQGDGGVFLRTIGSHGSRSKPLADPGTKGVNSVAFSPSGAALAVADGNGSTFVWNPRTGSITHALTDPRSRGVVQAVFSPDGTELAACDGNGRTYLWQLGLMPRRTHSEG